MIKKRSRNEMRVIRHKRLRKMVSGTAERPRMAVFHSLNHVYVQVIDDTKGHTLVSASTLEKPLKGTLSSTGNIEAAKAVGKSLAERAKQAGVSVVAFDRGQYLYHGRVKALAEAAREGGLKF